MPLNMRFPLHLVSRLSEHSQGNRYLPGSFAALCCNYVGSYPSLAASVLFADRSVALQVEASRVYQHDSSSLSFRAMQVKR